MTVLQFWSLSCKPFVRFISCTILDTLATGAISVWEEVSEVTNTFVWKSPDFIYHSIGLLALRYFCSVSIPCSMYLDECRGELKWPLQTPASKLSFSFSFLIEILQQCFRKRQQIISVHMEEILKIPTSTKDCLSWLHFVWIESNTTKEVWKIQDLIKLIRIEMETREASEGNSVHRDPSNRLSSNNNQRPQNKSKEIPTSTLYSRQNEKFRIRCLYCGQHHYYADRKLSDRRIMFYLFTTWS